MVLTNLHAMLTAFVWFVPHGLKEVARKINVGASSAMLGSGIEEPLPKKNEIYAGVMY